MSRVGFDQHLTELALTLRDQARDPQTGEFASGDALDDVAVSTATALATHATTGAVVEVTNIRPLTSTGGRPGITTTVVAEVNGQMSILKPAAGAGQGPLTGEHEVAAEKAAYEVAKLLGDPVRVPETDLMQVKFEGAVTERYSPLMTEEVKLSELSGLTSVQSWVPDSTVGGFRSQDDTRMMTAFDVLIGNADRHEANWVTDVRDQTWLVDHSRAFTGHLFKSAASWAEGQDWSMFPPEAREMFENALESLPEIREIMVDAGLDEGYGDDLAERVEAVLAEMNREHRDFDRDEDGNLVPRARQERDPKTGEFTAGGAGETATGQAVRKVQVLGGGIDTTLTAKIDGQMVVLKPALGSSFHLDTVRHEVAAPLIAEALGTRVQVPDAREEQIDLRGSLKDPESHPPVLELESLSGPTAVMNFVPNEGTVASVTGWHLASWLKSKEGDPDYEQHVDDVRQMLMFDSVIGNGDRHMGNAVIGEDGRLAAIDHGLAFAPQAMLPGAAAVSAYDSPLGPLNPTLRPDERAQLETFLTVFDARRHELSAQLTDLEANALRTRVELMLEQGILHPSITQDQVFDAEEELLQAVAAGDVDEADANELLGRAMRQERDPQTGEFTSSSLLPGDPFAEQVAAILATKAVTEETLPDRGLPHDAELRLFSKYEPDDGYPDSADSRLAFYPPGPSLDAKQLDMLDAYVKGWGGRDKLVESLLQNDDYQYALQDAMRALFPSGTATIWRGGEVGSGYGNGSFSKNSAFAFASGFSEIDSPRTQENLHAYEVPIEQIVGLGSTAEQEVFFKLDSSVRQVRAMRQDRDPQTGEFASSGGTATPAPTGDRVGRLDSGQYLTRIKTVPGNSHYAGRMFFAKLDGEPVFVKFSTSTDQQREMAARVVNEGLGRLCEIPDAQLQQADDMGTGRHEFDGQTALIVDRIDGDTIGPEVGKTGDFSQLWKDAPEAEFRDMAVFDAVIANVNRHPGNAMIDEDGKMVTIDFGHGFRDSSYKGSGGNYSQYRYLNETEDWSLSLRQVGALENLLSDRETVTRELTDLGLSDLQTRDVFERAQALLDHGEIPRDLTTFIKTNGEELGTVEQAARRARFADHLRRLMSRQERDPQTGEFASGGAVDELEMENQTIPEPPSVAAYEVVAEKLASITKGDVGVNSNTALQTMQREFTEKFGDPFEAALKATQSWQSGAKLDPTGPPTENGIQAFHTQELWQDTVDQVQAAAENIVFERDAEPGFSEEHEDIARTFLNMIEASPPSPALFRSIVVDDPGGFVNGLLETKVLEEPLGSFSSDRQWAFEFGATRTTPEQGLVLFELEQGAQAANLTPLAQNAQYAEAGEWIASGRFEVLEVAVGLEESSDIWRSEILDAEAIPPTRVYSVTIREIE